ncbi:hypothetical protein BH23GEM3_BH23GEM3_03620 [soil metagenome]|jgi:hypothetical protein
MSATADSIDQLREQANEQYWTSSETVSQLAERLGISRNAMYSSVQPMPAGASCMQCDEPLVFTNRTSRTARTATCPACEAQVSLDAGLATPPAGNDLGPGTAVPVAPANGSQSRWEDWKEDAATVPAERVAMIGGAAALGVAIGAAAVKVIRKRS